MEDRYKDINGRISNFKWNYEKEKDEVIKVLNYFLFKRSNHNSFNRHLKYINEDIINSHCSKNVGDYMEFIINNLINKSDLIKYLSIFVKNNFGNDYFSDMIIDGLKYNVIDYIIKFLNKRTVYEIDQTMKKIDIYYDIEYYHIDYFDELIKSVIKDEYKAKNHIDEINNMFFDIIKQIIKKIKINFAKNYF